MNVFHQIALRGLKKSRTRTLVTIVGVALAAALITGVATFGVSLLSYMTRGAALKYGDWQVSFADVQPSFADEQLNDARVRSVTDFENIGYAILDGAENPDKPYAFIAGFGDEDYEPLRIKLLSGRLPQSSSEILVSAHVITNGGVQISVGDTLTLAVGKRQRGSETLSQHDPYAYDEERLCSVLVKTYTVVGVCMRPSFEETTAPGYTLITKADAANSAERVSAFVTLNSPYQIGAYVRGAGAENGYFLNEEVLRFTGLSSDTLFTTLLLSVGAIVIAIIMIGSIFLIYNSFNISLNERTRQFGILMSVGATAKQLRNSVLFEGLCIGAVGIPIGVLAGLGSMSAVLSAVAQNFANILYAGVPLTTQISLPAIAGAAAVSLITILISAYIPARKAGNTPVMACIRQTNEVKAEPEAVKTSKLTSRICGLEGTLALKNFRRNQGRYRSIVLSLVLSVVLFIATSAFVEYLQQASQQAAVFTTYDIGISTPDMDDEQMKGLYDQLKTADGVADSSYQTLIACSATVLASELNDVFWQGETLADPGTEVELILQVQFLDDSTYLKIVNSLGLSAEEYTGENARLLACAQMEKSGTLAGNTGETEQLFAASVMDFVIVPETLDGGQSPQARHVSVAFADFVPPDCLPVLDKMETTPYYFHAAAPYSLKDSFVTENTRVRSKGLTFNSDSAARTAAELEDMLAQAGVLTGCTLYNMNEMLDQSRNMIFIAHVFGYTFIILISLIAIANVFNTISTNIRLRRRELAMLRSVGMSERAFQRMMNFECAFYGMRALMIGLPLAVLCSFLICKGIEAGGAEKIVFALPWTSMAVSVISVLFVIFTTMMYSVSKIRKENIIDALRDDMT